MRTYDFYPSDEYDSFEIEQERARRRRLVLRKFRRDDDDAPPSSPASARRPQPLPLGNAEAA